MKAVIVSHAPWRTIDVEGMSVSFCGDQATVETVARAARSGADAFGQALSSAVGHFACIIEGEDFVSAAVDNCRATPVFYADAFVSNRADAVREAANLSELNQPAVVEFAMSGFITGQDTLYDGLKQLQACEFLYVSKADGKMDVRQYYRFMPDQLSDASTDELAEISGAAFDRVMRRMVDSIGERTVWLPLSGGLDSRLIACKLVELGCPNVKTFSYGAPHNDEAAAASKVTDTLGLEWHFVPTRLKDGRRYFHSQMRQDFWEFTKGYDAVPNGQDLITLAEMMDKGLVQKGDVVVNGQSGDFITGGHIPLAKIEADPTLQGMFNAMADKHFSLWASLKTDENLNMIKDRVLAPFDIDPSAEYSVQDLCAMYEWSEYQERQCKFVVAGQRVYDFLGLDWYLPLWDPEFVEPWRNMPAHVKAGQAIYKHYLDDYNYKGLFEHFTPCMDGWPGMAKLVLPFARAVRLMFGEEARNKYLKAMAVFGQTGYHFAGYPKLRTMREAQNFRNPISLFARTWLQENDVNLPKGLSCGS